MELFDLLKLYKKLSAFLAGLIPGAPVARLRRLTDAVWARILAVGWVGALGRWIAGTRLYRAARTVATRFVWRDHRGDELDFASLPREIGPLLRTCLTFVAVGLVLIPVSVELGWLPVAARGLDMEVETVSAITVYVVAAGVVLGWSALIAGAAHANVWAFGLATLFSAYMVLPLGEAAPFTGAMVLFPLALLLALCGAERPVSGTLPRRLVLGVLVGLLLGVTVSRGFGLLHLPPGLAALLLAPALVATAALRAARESFVGAVARAVGLLALVAAVRGALVLPFALGDGLSPTAAADLTVQIAVATVALQVALSMAHGRRPLPLAPLTAATGLALTIVLLSALAQAGHEPVFAALSLHLAAFDGYLWMIWYFIGVGLVYKLLKETQALARAADLLMPGPLLALAWIGAVALALLIGFAEPLLLALGGLFPEAQILLTVYRAWSWLLSEPDHYRTVMVLRWVVIVFVGVLVYLAARRKLDRPRALSVGFVLLFAGVVIYEYFFETFAFVGHGGPRDRTLASLLFAVWILWLTYSVGMRAASGDSPGFPRAGRTGIYAGVVVLIGAVLHINVVTRPTVLADRTFLQLFVGLMHVGLPYFLYVYLGRRYKHAPVSTRRLAAAFALGIAAQLPVILLAKAAIGGYSPAGFAAVVRLCHDGLLADGSLPPGLARPATPLFWALAVGLGLALRIGALAWVRPHPLTAVAVFTGFGSAAVMALNLPLLPTVAWSAIYPLHHPLSLTRELALHHGLHLLLALVMAHAVVGHRRWGLVVGGCFVASIELLVSLGHAAFDDYLVSTGLTWTVLVVVIGAAALLFVALERRIAPELRGDERVTAQRSRDGDAGPLVPGWHLALLAVLVAGALSAVSVLAITSRRMLPVDAGRVTFAVPAHWLPYPLPDAAMSWVRRERSGAALLLFNRDPVPADSTPAVELARLDAAFATTALEFHIEDLGSAGPLQRRWSLFQLPTPEGPGPWQEAEQVVLFDGDELLRWTYTGDSGPAFEGQRADFRRVVASIRPSAPR